jgi:general secretion pathway protein K
MLQRKQSQQHPNGGALISALFITAIAAIIATALAVEVRLLIHEGELVTGSDQSYLNCENIQLLAEKAILTYSAQWADPKSLPSQITPLPAKIEKIKIGNMVLSGTLDNEQGKFNINDLAYSANQPRFVALLQAVVQGISLQQSYDIAKSITAWITSDADNKYYLSLNPPYQSPKSPMTDISELRLVKGMTPDIFSALKPYVTALPVTPPTAEAPASSSSPATPAAPAQKSAPETAIDINAASAPALLTTDPTLTLAQATMLANCRQQFGGFSSTAAFLADCAQAQSISGLTNITAQSHYFLVNAHANWNHHMVLLKRLVVTQAQKNNTLKTVIVWQSFE